MASTILHVPLHNAPARNRSTASEPKTGRANLLCYLFSLETIKEFVSLFFWPIFRKIMRSYLSRIQSHRGEIKTENLAGKHNHLFVKISPATRNQANCSFVALRATNMLLEYHCSYDHRKLSCAQKEKQSYIACRCVKNKRPMTATKMELDPQLNVPAKSLYDDFNWITLHPEHGKWT